MTLGNMRADDVRSLDVCCWVCHHRTILSADPWSDDVPVPTFGPRMVCTRCGIIGADARAVLRFCTAVAGLSPAATAAVSRMRARMKPSPFARLTGSERSECASVLASASPSHFLKSLRECIGAPTCVCEPPPASEEPPRSAMADGAPAMLNGRCRLHGGKSPGAPKGNTNAFKHGPYSAEAIEARRKIAALFRTMRTVVRASRQADAL
jgi:hypothetical protein